MKKFIKRCSKLMAVVLSIVLLSTIMPHNLIKADTTIPISLGVEGGGEIKINNGGWFSYTKNINANPGDTVTLNARATTGSHFVCFMRSDVKFDYDNAYFFSSDNPCVFTATEESYYFFALFEDNTEMHTVTLKGNGHGGDTLTTFEVQDGKTLSYGRQWYKGQTDYDSYYREITEDNKIYRVRSYTTTPTGSSFFSPTSTTVLKDWEIYAQWDEINYIDDIEVTVTPPSEAIAVSGDTMATQDPYPVVTLPSNVNYDFYYDPAPEYDDDICAPGYFYYDGSFTGLFEGTMAPGETYGIRIYLIEDDGYVFRDNPNVTVNGATLVDYDSSDGSIDCTFTAPYPSATASGNITIGENFAATVNLVLEDTYSNYTVSYEFLDESHNVPVTGQNVSIRVDDIYSFQLGKPITVDVYYQGNLVKTFDYSVKDYCEYQINHSNNINIVNLCKSVLNYGAASQIYFNGKPYSGGTYDTDVTHLVNADVDTTLADASKPINEKQITGDLNGKVSDVRCSLILGSEVSMKFYLITDGTLDLSSFSASCEPDKTVTSIVDEGEGTYSIKVTGLTAVQLGTDHVVTFNEGGQSMQVTYSPYAFASAKWDDGNDLAELCKKLVTYGECALACI